uniref:aminopeptidase P family protein n=1 Tax=Paramuribaculum intestinale TaxID=2094151 RepID=UPI0025B6F5CF
MFEKDIYVRRRAELKKRVGSGTLLFLGNDECGCNYADNTYPFRQDSTFLYYFGLPYDGLAAVIDIDNDQEIIFGDELTIDHIVWMGTQPTLHEKAHLVGVDNVRPSADLKSWLDRSLQIRYLPVYRAEHRLKLWRLLGIMPGEEKPSAEFIRAVVDMRNHKQPEEIAEIEKACDVTSDMHIAATKAIRPGMYEYEVAAIIEQVAASANCSLAFPTICTINGQTLHNHYHGNRINEGDMVLIDAGAERPSGYA